MAGHSAHATLAHAASATAAATCGGSARAAHPSQSRSSRAPHAPTAYDTAVRLMSSPEEARRRAHALLAHALLAHALDHTSAHALAHAPLLAYLLAHTLQDGALRVGGAVSVLVGRGLLVTSRLLTTSPMAGWPRQPLDSLNRWTRWTGEANGWRGRATAEPGPPWG